MEASLPETIVAGGKTRLVTQHMRNDPHKEINAERVKHVLENWWFAASEESVAED